MQCYKAIKLTSSEVHFPRLFTIKISLKKIMQKKGSHTSAFKIYKPRELSPNCQYVCYEVNKIMIYKLGKVA